MVHLAYTLSRYRRTQSANLKSVLRLVSSGESQAVTAQAMCALWDSLSEDEQQELKLALLDLLLFIMEEFLDDHTLGEDEQEALQYLKRLFRVEEGDFYTLKRDGITDVLRGEISLILADRSVDAVEALQQVALQRAFDLSYDQYLELTHGYVSRIVDDTIARIAADGYVDDEERERVFPQIRALDTVYRLDATRTRLIYNDADLELPAVSGDAASRPIPQEVKDLVWRRDQGRCVQCGSRHRLEFDHIIPFSRGGASTYRNVQLLCENCNRKKSGAIG
jgi:hypothetical protein